MRTPIRRLLSLPSLHSYTKAHITNKFINCFISVRYFFLIFTQTFPSSRINFIIKLDIIVRQPRHNELNPSLSYNQKAVIESRAFSFCYYFLNELIYHLSSCPFPRASFLKHTCANLFYIKLCASTEASSIKFIDSCNSWQLFLQINKLILVD